ncbi:MAG: phosphoribosylamine---glycine ligase [Gaiellaceae bacterium]|jgi:phosphoribosylamine--glycine ligase|nr:phosphoribosylamine---glycine ligase [Gaiellaceae bacterium]
MHNRQVRVLVVGSGGREHALCWSLSRSSGVGDLHAAPGNPGIAALTTCHPVRADDHAALCALAVDLRVDLVVVGPEAPLVAGLADELRRRGIAVFGPSAAAARIEGSKAFAKDVMGAAGVPSARTLDRAEPPCVVKLDGLAAGKGVWVCRTQDELDEALAAAQEPFHCEELLEGPELSVFAIAAGESAVVLPPARDYKRVGDGDTGPNTGGMGSFSPLPDVPDAEAEEILETIHLPVLRELARRGSPFHGTLYGGLMRTPDGLRVIEFNCRFGDPDTQPMLARLESDLLPLLLGELSAPVEVSSRAAVTVVLAGGDYPASADKGTPIEGIEDAEATGALVFHAGTALHDGRLVTNGGRVVNVVATGATVADARTAAYDAVSRIHFAGMQFRTDIAANG